MSDVAVWVAIFAFGLLGLNWPLLAIFHEAPFVYLLAFWLLFVAIVGLAARGERPPPGGKR